MAFRVPFLVLMLSLLSKLCFGASTPKPARTSSVTLSNDLTIAYLDSGSVSGDYVTYVFVHGMGFNAGVYQKLVDIAPREKVRVIAAYRTDYKPSSNFSAAQTAPLGDPATQGQFYEELGHTWLEFVDVIAQKHSLPKTSTKGCIKGGIALVGWSLGVTMTFPVLAYLDTAPADRVKRVQSYLHTVIYHDTGVVYFGVPNPPEYNIDLWFEPDVNKRFSLFLDWATGYYPHKNINSQNKTTLEFNTAGPKPHTFHDVHPVDLARLTDVVPFGGSDLLVLLTDLNVNKEATRRAFFDANIAKLLPRVRVRFLASAESPGVLVYALWVLKDLIKNPLPMYGAPLARDVQSRYTTKGNHFVFWDSPEYALSEFKKLVKD